MQDADLEIRQKGKLNNDNKFKIRIELQNSIDWEIFNFFKFFYYTLLLSWKCKLEKRYDVHM